MQGFHQSSPEAGTGGGQEEPPPVWVLQAFLLGLAPSEWPENLSPIQTLTH